MNTKAAYNQNEELVAMKDDIANRKFGLMLKEGLIMVGTVAGGAVLGAVAAPVVLGSAGAAVTGAMVGGFGGLYGGAMAAEVLTMKDRTKLEIDNQMVESYMSGKNYWGEGYREEVAEKGYGFGHTPPATPMLAQNGPQGPGRLS